MWRLFIGLGAVPAAVALYFRLTIPETPRFTMDVKRNLDKAAADIRAVFPGKGKSRAGKRPDIEHRGFEDLAGLSSEAARGTATTASAYF